MLPTSDLFFKMEIRTRKMRKDNIEQQFSSVITVFINLLFITGIDLYLSIMLLVCFFLYIIKSLEEQQCC